MIRRFLLAAVFAVSIQASAAEPVSFSFTAVPLVDFAQATYRNLLGRDFVLSNDLVSMGKKVTVSVKSLQVEQVPAFVENVLRAHGVRSVQRDGVYFLELGPTVDTNGSAPAGEIGQKSQSDQPLAEGAVDVPNSLAPASPNKVKVLTVKHRSVAFVAEAVSAVLGLPVRPVGGSALAIAAPDEQLAIATDLVDQLDVPVAVVEVSASFVEVTRNGSSARGVSLVADALSRQLDGVSIVPGEGRLSVRAGRYELVLNALAADGRFKQVSNSRLVGDDSEQLTLSVGDETPTVSSTSRDQAGNFIQNVVYRPSGVILDVLPRVLGSGRLSLVVDGQVSSFQATTTGVSASPTLVKRQVKTSVSIDDGQVLVIGGLDDSKTSGNESGFSFLPRMWRNTSSTDSKTDLVLILSARVVPNGEAVAVK